MEWEEEKIRWHEFGYDRSNFDASIIPVAGFAQFLMENACEKRVSKRAVDSSFLAISRIMYRRRYFTFWIAREAPSPQFVFVVQCQVRRIERFSKLDQWLYRWVIVIRTSFRWTGLENSLNDAKLIFHILSITTRAIPRRRFSHQIELGTGVDIYALSKVARSTWQTEM